MDISFEFGCGGLRQFASVISRYECGGLGALRLERPGGPRRSWTSARSTRTLPGAVTPRRTLFPRIATTVTQIAASITICSPTPRERTNMAHLLAKGEASPRLTACHDQTCPPLSKDRLAPIRPETAR